MIIATNLYLNTVESRFVTCKDSHLAINLGNITNGVLGEVVSITVACFFVSSTQPFLVGVGATPVLTFTAT